MGEEYKNPEQSSEIEAPKPAAHEDVCHTARGHSVPDGCTDVDGAPLVQAP